MSDASVPATNPFADIAPALGQYNDDILFGAMDQRQSIKVMVKL